MVLSSRRLPSLIRVPASLVPRCHRYYEGATTSHLRVSGHLLVRFHCPPDPPALCPPWRSRRSGGPLPARALGAGRPHFRLLRVDANGISQVFRRSFPCLCSAPGPRSNRRGLAVDDHIGAAPAGWTAKASAMSDFGANTQLRHPLTYASRGRCRTRARLASGWSANLCREGVEPSGSQWEVSARVDGHPPPLLS